MSIHINHSAGICPSPLEAFPAYLSQQTIFSLSDFCVSVIDFSSDFSALFFPFFSILDTGLPGPVSLRSSSCPKEAVASATAFLRKRPGSDSEGKLVGIPGTFKEKPVVSIT